MIGLWVLAGVACWAIILGMLVSPWLVVAGAVVLTLLVWLC